MLRHYNIVAIRAPSSSPLPSSSFIATTACPRAHAISAHLPSDLERVRSWVLSLAGIELLAVTGVDSEGIWVASVSGMHLQRSAATTPVAAETVRRTRYSLIYTCWLPPVRFFCYIVFQLFVLLSLKATFLMTVNSDLSEFSKAQAGCLPQAAISEGPKLLERSRFTSCSNRANPGAASLAQKPPRKSSTTLHPSRSGLISRSCNRTSELCWIDLALRYCSRGVHASTMFSLINQD